MQSRRRLAQFARAAWPVGLLLGGAPTAGWAAPGCDAVVYWDANFGGESMEVRDDEPFVGPHWNDQIASIRIVSGDWTFYADAQYRGDVLRHGPGPYPALTPDWSKRISSFRCAGASATGADGGSSGGDAYSYGGQSYGWYDDGWNGPGFYVIGLATARGRGFGGREGFHGWHHHGRHDRDHDRSHDHDHGGDRGPHPPGPGAGRPPGPGPGFHPPARPRPEKPDRPPRAGPRSRPHPEPRPHPGPRPHPEPRAHPHPGHPGPHPHPHPHRR